MRLCGSRRRRGSDSNYDVISSHDRSGVLRHFFELEFENLEEGVNEVASLIAKQALGMILSHALSISSPKPCIRLVDYARIVESTNRAYRYKAS